MATFPKIFQHQDWMREELPHGGEELTISSVYRVLVPRMDMKLSAALATATLLELPPPMEDVFVARIIAGGEECPEYQWLLKYWDLVRELGENARVKGLYGKDKRQIYRGTVAYGMKQARDVLLEGLREMLGTRGRSSATYRVNPYGDVDSSWNHPETVGFHLMTIRDTQYDDDEHDYLTAISRYLTHQVAAGEVDADLMEEFIDGVDDELDEHGSEEEFAPWGPRCSALLENVGWVRKSTLPGFIALAEEYNWEWALSSYDWEEASGGVDLREGVYNFIRESPWGGKDFMAEFSEDVKEPRPSLSPMTSGTRTWMPGMISTSRGSWMTFSPRRSLP